MVTGKNTAIRRKTLSVPMLWLSQKGHILPGGKSRRFLDYGCGRGEDALMMGWESYDPHWEPRKLKPFTYDTITCNYVLNVLDAEEQIDVLKSIASLLTEDGVVYISVRRDLWKRKQSWDRDSKPGRGCEQHYVFMYMQEPFRETAEYAIYRFTPYWLRKEIAHRMDRILTRYIPVTR